LVVDDNVDTATSLAMLLDLQGHAVETAHDGARAVEAARTRTYDVLLLDLGLPVVDGYEAARQIRALGGDPRPLLVAISGYGFDTDRARARAAGFDHHLVKPVELAAITAILPARARGD
jgi:CheY-like chemotaxis protein